MKRFRPDIEALRAIAIVSVLVYHLDSALLPGGYVGVDVFYVISGFLITQGLSREIRANGRVDYLGFLVRRMRRLFPSSAFVIVVASTLMWFLMPPIWVQGIAKSVVASALYIANVYFAIAGVDYLQESVSVSPFQHYWSLSLEEQFYLVWPWVLVSAAWRVRKVRPSVLVVVLAGSFVASVVLTPIEPAVAFFMLPTRAWEMVAGALIAIWTNRAPTPTWSRFALIPAFGLLLASLALFSDTTAFPGYLAGVPVASASVLIAVGFGLPQTGHVRDLILWIGRRSYVIYLWHWPLIVMSRVAGLESSLGHAWWALCVLGVTVGLSELTARLVEDPFRYSERLAGSLRVSAGFAALVLCTTSGIGFLLAAWPHEQSFAARVSPVQSSADFAVRLTARDGALPENVVPPLEVVRDSVPVLYRDGCHAPQSATQVNPCVYGADSDGASVVLLGDSHAAQWFPAIRVAAREEGVSVAVLTKSACPASLMHFFRRGVRYRECERWLSSALDWIAESDARVVFVASRAFGRKSAAYQDLEGYLNGLERLLERLVTSGKRVVVIGDSPSFPIDPPVCAAYFWNRVSRCASARSVVSNRSVIVSERRIAAGLGSLYLSPVDWFCDGSVCPVVVGNVLLYRDMNHLTVEAVELHSSRFRTLVR